MMKENRTFYTLEVMTLIKDNDAKTCKKVRVIITEDTVGNKIILFSNG